jgi:UDP-N-acetylmuramoylalanine--D-glutamate ligase
MSDAVKRAFRLAEQGDAVLLSPACSSFDMFKSYADRGDRFRDAVDRLRAEVSA